MINPDKYGNLKKKNPLSFIMRHVSLLVTEIQKQPRFSGGKIYIHGGHPQKKKRYGEGGMLILTFPFLP